MAVDAAQLKSDILAQFTAHGFDISKTPYPDRLANSIAQAVANRVNTDLEVVVPSGSSAGTYPVT